MKRNIFSSKKWIKPFIVIFGVITACFYGVSFFIDCDWLEVLGVSLLTTYYFSCLRPLSGGFVNRKYKNRINFKKKWFQVKPFEIKLYKFLRVKKWKKFLPTYDEKSFELKTHSFSEIIGATCQAEIVHEIMFVLSFLPLLLIIPYGTVVVFVVSSVLCALGELCCVAVQRYNRARLFRVLSKVEKTRI